MVSRRGSIGLNGDEKPLRSSLIIPRKKPFVFKLECFPPQVIKMKTEACLALLIPSGRMMLAMSLIDEDEMGPSMYSRGPPLELSGPLLDGTSASQDRRKVTAEERSKATTTICEWIRKTKKEFPVLKYRWNILAADHQYTISPTNGLIVESVVPGDESTDAFTIEQFLCGWKISIITFEILERREDGTFGKLVHHKTFRINDRLLMR
jgi:hypothetical protein